MLLRTATRLIGAPKQLRLQLIQILINTIRVYGTYLIYVVLVICEKVEERAERIQAEYTAIKEQQNEREENENELFRGCSGTNREDVAKRR